MIIRIVNYSWFSLAFEDEIKKLIIDLEKIEN